VQATTHVFLLDGHVGEVNEGVVDVLHVVVVLGVAKTCEPVGVLETSKHKTEANKTVTERAC
jgi:hypothetical protein